MEQKILSEDVTQVNDIEFESLLPTTVDEVTIKVENGKREIGLPDSMNGEKFVTWKKRRGGIFYKDVFEFSRGRDHGKYVQLIGEDLEYIVRLIDEEELEDFQVRRLIHGKIKDKPFMILHNRSEIEDFDGKDGYINENDPEETEDFMVINTINIPQEDEEAGSAKSISLFD